MGGGGVRWRAQVPGFCNNLCMRERSGWGFFLFLFLLPPGTFLFSRALSESSFPPRTSSRERLFKSINSLPTVYETLTGKATSKPKANKKAAVAAAQQVSALDGTLGNFFMYFHIHIVFFFFFS